MESISSVIYDLTHIYAVVFVSWNRLMVALHIIAPSYSIVSMCVWSSSGSKWEIMNNEFR